MNVYTQSFLDFFNWPTSCSADVVILSSGGQLAIPRIATKLEILADLYLSIFYFFSDFQYNFKLLTDICELTSITFFNWILPQIYSGLIAEFYVNTVSSVEISIYEPANWLVLVFNIYCVIVLFFLSLLYIYTYGLRNNSTRRGLVEGGIFLYAYLDEVEEECGQIEDVLSYLLYFAVFVLWFYFFNIFAATIIINNLNWLLTIFCFVLILGVVVPSSLLNQMGLAFVQYVRGSGRGTSLIFETLLDFVSVSVIVIRFFVQNVRFVFIFVGFFEYYEYIDGKTQPLHDLLLPHITWGDFWLGAYTDWHWFELLTQLLVQFISYFYYVGHLTITYIAQLSIYLILSFWIYFFLYTTFSLPSKEKYFFFRRHVLL